MTVANSGILSHKSAVFLNAHRMGNLDGSGNSGTAGFVCSIGQKGFALANNLPPIQDVGNC